MKEFEKQKMEIDIEIRSLSDKIKEGSIKADEAKVQFEELRAKKAEIEKQIAVQNAPQTRDNETVKSIADVAKAFQEKRAITLSGTGIVNTVRELVKIMSSKKTILEKVKYFYGENASTVIPVWGSSLTRPAPVTEGGNITAETTNPLGNQTLTTSAFAVSIPVSNETLKLSGVQFEAELQSILADTFSDAIAWEVFNGTGTGGHFTSVLTDDANIITSHATTLKIADLANLALSIADKTDNGCIFMPPTIYNTFIADTTDAQKVYREDLIRNKMIENVPIFLTSYAPSDITTGKKVAVAADFQNYAVAVAGELHIEPKKTAGTLTTTFDVDMYLAGKPTVAKNFSILKVK